eukprot:Filipodium_phascolosomae@DN3400_c0_g1_i1.p1
MSSEKDNSKTEEEQPNTEENHPKPENDAELSLPVKKRRVEDAAADGGGADDAPSTGTEDTPESEASSPSEELDMNSEEAERYRKALAELGGDEVEELDSAEEFSSEGSEGSDEEASAEGQSSEND